MILSSAIADLIPSVLASDLEANAYAIADNRTHEFADWDEVAGDASYVSYPDTP